MSTRVMSLCWPLQMAPTQKAVLISLADQANDAGVCWPSVGTICERTCLSERTVQRAIGELMEAGILTARDRTGRSSVYTITPVTVTPPSDSHPRHGDTPPPSGWHPTPVTVTPHPRHSDTQNRNRTIKEPSKNQKKAVGLPDLPEWMPPQVWGEWIAHRKAIGKPMTAGAERLTLRNLTEMFTAGHDPVAALELSIASGWTGVFPPKLQARAAPARQQFKTASDRQAEAIYRITGGLAGKPPTDERTIDV